MQLTPDEKKAILWHLNRGKKYAANDGFKTNVHPITFFADLETACDKLIEELK